MIPEFNAIGNHPTDIVTNVRMRVRAMYKRLGIEDRSRQGEEVLLHALADLLARPHDFTGYHRPSHVTRRVSDLLIDTLLRPNDCKLAGADHCRKVLDLTATGNNVVIISNHTTPVDALLSIALFGRFFEISLPDIIISQVFEYSRVARLLTSGFGKYPVFQPKHMQRFAGTRGGAVLSEMTSQNSRALRALYDRMQVGGSSVFLYPERDRSSGQMGIPEPATGRLLELIAKARDGLSLLPIYVSGNEAVLPNRPGFNELDECLEHLQIGSGTMICGRPIHFSNLTKVIDSIDQASFVEEVIRTRTEDPRRMRQWALIIAALGSVATLAHSEQEKGVYANLAVQDIVSRLYLLS